MIPYADREACAILVGATSLGATCVPNPNERPPGDMGPGTVEVGFARPILLPAKVGAWWRREPDGWRAAVTSRDGAKPYLVARVTPG